MKYSSIASCALLFIISADTVQAQVNYPVDFRAGVVTGGVKRNVSLDNTVTGKADASIKGFELMLSSAKGGGGIGGRVLDGSFGAEKFTLREGRVFVGEKAFHAEGAYGERSLSGTDSMTTYSRAGIRSVVHIGGTGVLLSISGSKYFPGNLFKKKADDADKVTGWEAETGIFYATPKIPAFAQIGYRTEYFSFGQREEHLSGIVFGLGLWLGGR